MTAPVSTNIANPGNFLRSSRNFPTDPQALTVEVNKAYVDIANQVNNRISGIFGTSPTITGESWFVNGQTGKQQSLRRVYPITGAGTYAHGITTNQISGFTKIYGTFVDNVGVWYPLPYVDVASSTNQVNVIVNTTDIVITAGAGTPPTISSGFVILEWLSLV